MSQKRNSNLELLRIISMLLVVLFHYGIHGNGEKIFSSDSSLNQIVTYLFCSWGLVGVYCFFFISFWFIQESNKVSIVKVLELYFKVVLMDVLACLISLFAGQSISGRRLLECILAPLTCRYWFITVYLVMYIINPYLKVIIRGVSNRSLVFLTALLVCMSTVFKMLSPYIGGGQLISPLTLGICIYFLTVVLKKFHNRLQVYNWLILSVCTFAGVWLMESILSICATKMNIAGIHKHIYDLVDIYSIFPLIVSVCLFELFLHMRLAYNKVINWMGAHMLCIYLFHENPTFRYWIWDDIFNIGMFYGKTTIVYLLHMVLVTSVLVTVGIILDVVFTKSWKSIIKLFHKRLELLEAALRKMYMEDENV